MITAALIGAGASILGNVLQRNAQEAAYKRQQAQLDQARANENAHYMRRYYEDGTQRADTQRALTQARQNLLRSNMAYAGRNAVMGGTNAQAAAAKEISSNAYANAVASAASSAEQRKDTIDSQHMTRINALDQQKMTLDAQNDQANASAIGQMANQVGSLAQSAIASEFTGKEAAQPSAAATSVPDGTTPAGAMSVAEPVAAPLVTEQAPINLSTQLGLNEKYGVGGTASLTPKTDARLSKWDKLLI